MHTNGSWKCTAASLVKAGVGDIEKTSKWRWMLSILLVQTEAKLLSRTAVSLGWYNDVAFMQNRLEMD